MTELILSIARAVFVVMFGMNVAVICTWVDRRQGAMIQDRVGLDRAVIWLSVWFARPLALLPALAVVRRRRVLAVGLGPGVLGGFTTLWAYSEQTRALLDHGQTGTATLYLVGTLGACLVAVALASRVGER